MGRGRTLNTKIKEARAIAKALIEGFQKADEKKPLVESLKDHLGRMIDRVDPIKIMAIGSLTIILQPIIAELPDVVGMATKVSTVYGVQYEVIKWLFGRIAGPAAIGEQPAVQAPEPNTWGSWLISFVVAFMIIEYGGEIISAVGSLAKFVGLLIGGAAI